MRIIYLAWINDHLLDVFAHKADALNRIDAEKLRMPDERWKQLPSGRWHSQGVARLEVEERAVI